MPKAEFIIFLKNLVHSISVIGTGIQPALKLENWELSLIFDFFRALI